jgi:hypothetical protein
MSGRCPGIKKGFGNGFNRNNIYLTVAIYDVSMLLAGRHYTGCHKYVPFAGFAKERHYGV